MPVERVIRAVLIDDLALTVSAWRYVCDGCGRRDVFPDHPMPEGRSEFEAQQKGWRIGILDEETCYCPSCCAAKDRKCAAGMDMTAGTS